MSLRIFVELDDSDQFRLMCADGMMSPAPCGQRLFRAAPYPDIQFAHPTMEAAETDARKLRAYLAALPVAKASKKRTAKSAA